jgi:beta-glucanase (GH16 family)
MNTSPDRPRRLYRLALPLLLTLALTLMLALPASTGAQPASTAPAQAGWNLVWSDEFNGTSVDANNWTFETGGGGWGNNELEYYTNGQNASVSGGVLTITANKISGGYSCWYGACQYTSTRINTKGKRQFQYGRIEARMALPAGQGLWPAFWMLGANFPGTAWPGCGEIDIMEHINNENVTHGTIHWDANGYANYGGPSGSVNVTTYHTYAVEWNSSSIKWFLDGVQFWEANIQNNINSTEEFHRPFFLILNLAVGGNWPGSPNASTVFPARMMVDYVRVYQTGTTTQPTPAPTTPPSTAFTQGVDNVSSTQARVWFKPNGWSAGYVILHYIRPGLAQQNVNMTYNSSAARWEYLVSGLSAGQTLQTSFTYQRSGAQYDTGWYNWTKP